MPVLSALVLSTVSAVLSVVPFVLSVASVVLSAVSVASGETEAVTFLFMVAANVSGGRDEEIISADANTIENRFNCIFPPKEYSKNYYRFPL